MDGLVNAFPRNETTRQAELSKHRILRVNLSSSGLLEPGDASSEASVDPNTIVAPNGGPHFVMSSETPDNSHAYGFEFCLFIIGMLPNPSTVAPFTVTVWSLIGNAQAQDPSASIPMVWAALDPATGVGLNELWHSFDVNASALWFQIEPEDGAWVTTDSLSIGIAFSEL